MPTASEPWPLTDEQRAVVALARDFAAREVRPRGREVDEADIVTPVDLFAKAAAVGITDFMIPAELRRWRVHRRVHPVPGAGRAVLG